MAALLMATTVFVVPAAADVGGSRDASEDVRVVRVAFPEVEGISVTDADGVRSGILYDWLAEVSKYTGWTYEFVDGDVQSLMKRTSAGEIDLMGGMYYREQLVDSFQYSNFAIGANHALLISLEENDDVVVFDSRTLNGKTIGVVENATEKISTISTASSCRSTTMPTRNAWTTAPPTWCWAATWTSPKAAGSPPSSTANRTT